MVSDWLNEHYILCSQEYHECAGGISVGSRSEIKSSLQMHIAENLWHKSSPDFATSKMRAATKQANQY